jgi:two-component sensor histidine kinase
MFPAADGPPQRAGAQPSPRFTSTLRTFSLWAAVTIVAVGCLAFLYTAARSASGSASPRSLSPTTALAFALAGLALFFKKSENAPARARLAADGLAICLIAAGAGELLMYLGSWNLYAAPTFGFISLRMAPASAVLFVMTGPGLLLLDVEDSRSRRPAQTLFIVLALFTIAALGISIFGSVTPRIGAYYAEMNWPTALLFMLLSAGALCARPNRGAMRAITLDAAGGDVARRLMPAALLAPLLLCILCYLGFKAGWYTAAFGLAILTTLNSAVLTALVWRTAGALNQSDEVRFDREAEIELLNARLRGAMAETHHRVRNNLQFISALADMQIMMDRETVPISEVKRIGAQVQALAAVHDLLTLQAKTEAGSDTLLAQEVLDRLADLLKLTVEGRNIEVRSDETPISGRQASAIAVIANELVINALKNSDTAVEVDFRSDNGEARLMVRDRGPGFPPGFDPAARARTGLELVQQISVWDLQGRIEFSNRPDGGACVDLRFPLKAA